MKSDSAQYGGRAVGTDALMQLLKNYCRNRELKTAITVGVIGYPNVGKSSLINSLKRSRAVSVSATAGHTKQMQEVILDKKIRLIDRYYIATAYHRCQKILIKYAVRVLSFNAAAPTAPVSSSMIPIWAVLCCAIA